MAHNSQNEWMDGELNEWLKNNSPNMSRWSNWMESKMVCPKVPCQRDGQRESLMVGTKVTDQRDGNPNSERPCTKNTCQMEG